MEPVVLKDLSHVIPLCLVECRGFGKDHSTFVIPAERSLADLEPQSCEKGLRLEEVAVRPNNPLTEKKVPKSLSTLPIRPLGQCLEGQDVVPEELHQELQRSLAEHL